MKNKDLKFDSRLIHAGSLDEPFGSASVPIYQSSTFAFKNAEHGAALFAGEEDGYIYTRIGNPTITALEENIASLEGGFGGIATSSGMGAVNSIYMALLSQGDHILSTDAVYGPSRSIIENHFSRFGVESSYVDSTDIEELKKNLRPNTKILYIETPANPTMGITDLKACAALARENNLIMVVDNTFCSPFLQNPIEFGAEVVFHSVTKFINGHADVVGGVIVTATEELYKKIRSMMVITGCNMDPHQAWLVLRGAKTLSLRIERSQSTAMKIAHYLEDHPKVEWVRYPGLQSHPQFELAGKQMRGYGAMISFGLKGGFETGKMLMDHLELATLAVSLGGVETLVQHPASMTHAGISAENKARAGITDDLVRYSVGIEDVDDLIADLEQALNSLL
ncbi:trans-sulfuration enzyme family protein [Bacteroidota bacterium]